MALGIDIPVEFLIGLASGFVAAIGVGYYLFKAKLTELRNLVDAVDDAFKDGILSDLETDEILALFKLLIAHKAPEPPAPEEPPVA